MYIAGGSILISGAMIVHAIAYGTVHLQRALLELRPVGQAVIEQQMSYRDEFRYVVEIMACAGIVMIVVGIIGSLRKKTA